VGATSMGMALTSSQPGRIGGITYGGGPVMTGRVNVYVIYYGQFDSNFAKARSIVEYFISNWGASHSYGVLRSYTGSNGRVAPELALAGVWPDTSAPGATLSETDVQTVVTTAIQNNTFPSDPNGIYLVILGSNMSATLGSGNNLCSQFCGYHDRATLLGADLKYGLVGAGNCTTCQIVSAPNGLLWAENIVNTMAHEIAETVTDPDGNAWGSQAKNDEVGDKCNFNFSERHNLPVNSNGNVIQATAKVGLNYYTIQSLWTPTNGGGCYSGYSPPAAVVWQQGPGGTVGAWKMKDQNTVSSYLYYNVPAGQNVIAVGDFSNGVDPQALTIGSSNNGPLTMWTLHGDGTADSTASLSSFDATQWKIVSTKDVNGDGFGDILFTNINTGETWLYLMQGSTVLSMQDLGIYLPWRPQGVADFNGDGLGDIFWVDSADQLYTYWLTSLPGGGPTKLQFDDPGQGTMSASYWGHPVGAVLGVADFNGDSRADVLYYPVNWPGLNDGVLFADFISTPFEQNNRFVANNILPDSPAFAGLVDVNRDGTSDIYLQTSAGLKFSTMGDWKSYPPVYGPATVGDPYTDFAVEATSAAFGDSGGWAVVGTGGFKEN
jgi:hypothetical protein